MNLNGALIGALGGLMTGGPIGGLGSGIGGLLGGGGALNMPGGGLDSFLAPPVFTPPPVVLTGPEYTSTATKLAHATPLHSIKSLAVYPGSGTPLVQTLVPALGILKPYFASGASVLLYLQQGLINVATLQKLSAAAGVPVSFPPDPAVSQLLVQSNMQQMQNLMFQQQMNTMSQQFSTLSNAQKSMHDAIMGMLNSVK